MIKWFESSGNPDFDLYGNGWGSGKVSSNRWYRPLNRIFSYLPDNRKIHSSWKGRAESKIEVLSKYKFNLCFENAKSYPGYITEKIFDCFKCGVVPIYLGPKEISEHIPKNSFLDRRNFKNDEELYLFIKNMREKEYDSYRRAALSFLNSSDSNLFKSKVMAPWFVEKILEVK